MGVTLDDLVKTDIDNEFGTLYIAEIDDEPNVAVFTINTPWHVFNKGVLETLDKALDLVESDAGIAGFVSYNQVGPYSNGFDLSQMKELISEVEKDESTAETTAKEILTLGQDVFARLSTMAKPSVAAVGGWTRGGGFEYALHHDFVFGTDNTNVEDPLKPWYFTVQLPEVKDVGVLPGWNGIPALLKRVLEGKLGDTIDDRTAEKVIQTLVEPVALKSYGPDKASVAQKKCYIDAEVQRDWKTNQNNGELLEESIYKVLDLAESYSPRTLDPIRVQPAPAKYRDRIANPTTPADFALGILYATGDTPEDRDWETFSRLATEGFVALTKIPERRQHLTGYCDKVLDFLGAVEKSYRENGVDLGWD